MKAPLDWRCRSDSILLTRDFIRVLQRCIASDFLSNRGDGRSIHICLVPSVRPVDSTGHGLCCIPYLDPPRDLPWHYVRSDSEISSVYGCDIRGCSRIIFWWLPRQILMGRQAVLVHTRLLGHFRTNPFYFRSSWPTAETLQEPKRNRRGKETKVRFAYWFTAQQSDLTLHRASRH